MYYLAMRESQHGCEQICDEYGNASAFRPRACGYQHAYGQQPPRDHDDNRVRNGRAPQRRTKRTTSSQGSSGWKVGAAFGIPGDIRAVRNATLRVTQIRHSNQSVGCITHRIFTIGLFSDAAVEMEWLKSDPRRMLRPKLSQQDPLDGTLRRCQRMTSELQCSVVRRRRPSRR